MVQEVGGGVEDEFSYCKKWERIWKEEEKWERKWKKEEK